MREIDRSPSEYYIRYLISRQPPSPPEEEPEPPSEDEDDDGRDYDDDEEGWDPGEVIGQLERLRLDGISPSYVRKLRDEMMPFPEIYAPETPNVETRRWLKHFKIFDMWHPTPAVRESQLILGDVYLREKLEPLLLSALQPAVVARRLRKFTSIALTAEGVVAYRHYFWNRRLLNQSQWMDYVSNQNNRNIYRQSLLAPPDMAPQLLPWVVGITGPTRTFNSAEAAARVGQIAFKHALELEHKPASADTTMALRNCMVTIEKADQVMRKSDVALRDVLKQFQKFRMKIDDAKVIDVHQLTDGNYSKSGEGTDVEDDDDF